MQHNDNKNGDSFSVLTQKKFNLIEFLEKWRQARISAIKQNIKVEYISALEAGYEEYLLNFVAPDNQEKVLRGVFDNSRKLGLSLVKFLGISLELQDIKDILMRSSIPCAIGTWESRPHAQVLKRQGCSSAQKAGPFYCNYWREAFDGFTMGVGEQERYARHKSIPHGDDECLDIYFIDNPKEKDNKWGRVPDHMLSQLSEIQEQFEKNMQTKLILEGLSEGVLYFKLESLNKDNPVCGTGAKLLHESLIKKVKSKFPGLSLMDTSPLAVYGEGTK